MAELEVYVGDITNLKVDARIIFACFSEEDAQIYKNLLQVEDHGQRPVQR